MKLLRFGFLVLCFCSVAASAQSDGKIQGLVKDEAGKGIGSATVSLLKAADSSLVKVALSESSGAFEFSNIKEGDYLFSASNVGHVKTFSAAFHLAAGAAAEVPAIVLAANNANMSAVVV